MLEQLLHFLCVFNKPTIYTIECTIWAIKYLILLMHGATMKTFFPPMLSNDLPLLFTKLSLMPSSQQFQKVHSQTPTHFPT